MVVRPAVKNRLELHKMDFLFYLQGWIGMVALMAFGNTVMCFRDHSFLSTRLYTGAANEVNGLAARLFGVWTLLAAALRLYCAFNIHNRGIYHMTLFSFLLACGHFLAETFIYGTASLTVGVITPLCISALSMVGMVIGYQYIGQATDLTDDRKFR